MDSVLAEPAASQISEIDEELVKLNSLEHVTACFFVFFAGWRYMKKPQDLRLTITGILSMVVFR